MPTNEIVSLGKVVERREKYETLVDLRGQQIEQLTSEFSSSRSIQENNATGIHKRKARKAVERNNAKIQVLSEYIDTELPVIDSNLAIAEVLSQEGNYPTDLLEADKAAYNQILEKLNAVSITVPEEKVLEPELANDKSDQIIAPEAELMMPDFRSAPIPVRQVELEVETGNDDLITRDVEDITTEESDKIIELIPTESDGVHTVASPDDLGEELIGSDLEAQPIEEGITLTEERVSEDETYTSADLDIEIIDLTQESDSAELQPETQIDSQEAPVTVSSGKRRYRKEADVDYKEKKAYVMPNGEIEELTEHRFITLSMVENGVMMRDELAKRLYPETFEKNKDEARGRVSALISAFNKDLSKKYDLRIVKTTSNDESRKGIDLEYWLQYYGNWEDVVLESENKGILQLPPFPELKHIESENRHKYDKEITVRSHSKIALETDPANRTSEQQQLLDDIEYFRKFYKFFDYQDIYTPEELRSFVEELKNVETKQPENFNYIKERIIDNLSKMDDRDGDLYDKSNGTKPKSWEWFKKNANRIVPYLEAKYQDSPEKKLYLLRLSDSEPEKRPDLTMVYRFLAYDFALRTIGKRENNVREKRKADYIENCEHVNSWYEEALPFIEQIPEDIKLPMSNRESTRLVSARWLIKDLVSSMNIRLTGNNFSGFDKKYTYDIPGALSQQQRIMHTVNQINAILVKMASETPSQEEIIPL